MYMPLILFWYAQWFARLSHHPSSQLEQWKCQNSRQIKLNLKIFNLKRRKKPYLWTSIIANEFAFMQIKNISQHIGASVQRRPSKRYVGFQIF